MRGDRTRTRRLREISRRRLKFVGVVGVIALVAVACKPAVSGTFVGPTGFESADGYHPGSINGQQSWASTGPFDQAISTQSAAGTTPGFFGFDAQSWQISDAVNEGNFADQPLSPQTADQSGETDASGASNNGDTGRHDPRILGIELRVR